MILTTWGRNEKRLGYAADFCPVCRKVTAFGVDQLQVSMQVCFVPVGEGRALGLSQTCTGCNIAFSSDPGRFVRLSPDKGETIAHLAMATFPTMLEKYAGRLEIERQIAVDPHGLDAGLRREMLMEPFGLAEPLFANNEDDTGMRLLATALRALEPSEAEIQECLGNYTNGNARLGMVSAAVILKEMSYDPTKHDFDY